MSFCNFRQPQSSLVQIQRQCLYKTPEKFRIKILRQKLPNDFFRQKKVKSSLAERYKSQQYGKACYDPPSFLQSSKNLNKKITDANQNNQNLLLQVINTAREARKRFRAESFKIATKTRERDQSLGLPILKKGFSMKLNP